MYSNGNATVATTGATAGAGATGINELPDTGGSFLGLVYTLLTPDSLIGVLFVVCALWAIIGAGVAIWRIVPRDEG